MYQKPAVTEVGIESEASYCCQVISVGGGETVIPGAHVTGGGTVENPVSGDSISALLAAAGIYAEFNPQPGQVEYVLPEVVLEPATVEVPTVTACI